MASPTAFFALFVTVTVGCLFQGSFCSERERLVRKLTKNYLSSVEPDNVVLKIGVSLQCSRYDRTSGELVTNAWEKFFWTDSRLRWDPKDFGGIEILRIPSRLLWTPDFKLYNSLKPTEERDTLVNALVSSEGAVTWIPSVLYRTLCSNEPTGSGLVCQILTGSWTYDGDTIKLEKLDQAIDLSSYYNTTCPLTVQEATAIIRNKYYPCCKEPYSSFEVNLHLKPQL